MTEPKPTYDTKDFAYGGNVADWHSPSAADKYIINNEPLSNKQLHELITSQQMTIDRLLTRQGEMLEAMKEMRAWLNDPAYVIVPTVANNLKAIIARVMG